MQKLALSVLLLPLLLALTPTVRADSYENTIEAFRRAGESGRYFQDAYGYAVFPVIGKGGVAFGAAYGEGRAYVQDRHVGNCTVVQFSWGLQFGGQAYSQIIFFEDHRAFEDFASGNFEFGARASGVVITAGASAEATTGGGVGVGVSGGRNDAATANLGYRRGMAVFNIAIGGLMYEAALAGQKFSYTPL